MLTKLLHFCGLNLGPQSDLMPPQFDNPEGFWEHVGFVSLNDELLNELGGAWDSPPNPDQTLTRARLNRLRKKAQLLIDGFDSTSVWGWKDPRNSLTLRFWSSLLPRLKVVIAVRNPLEVAYSMHERNGTSYLFGLRLWEIYNRCLIEAAGRQERLVTHYDFFFEDPESELRRVADFIGLSDAEVQGAAALVTKQRRHAHFTTDELIDARVSVEVIDLYRALVAEADQGRAAWGRKAQKENVTRKGLPEARAAKLTTPDSFPPAVSRLNSFVPKYPVRIKPLHDWLQDTQGRHKYEVEALVAILSQEEARHMSQIEELGARLARAEARHKSEMEELGARLTRAQVLPRSEFPELSAHLAQEEARHKSQVEQLNSYLAEEEAQHKSQLAELSLQLAQEEARHKWQVERLSAHLTQEEAQHRWQIENLSSHLKGDIDKLPNADDRFSSRRIASA